MMALHTVTNSYAKYSFPLACMTFSDIQKLDMIRTRICKKIHKIPLCTPSAMIHQDRECAGVGLTSLAVPYTEMVCKYLTQALNDNGCRGFTTRALLILQKCQRWNTATATCSQQEIPKTNITLPCGLPVSHDAKLRFAPRYASRM